LANARDIRDRVANDFRFLKGWMTQPRSVGSIKPTSEQAARLMVSLIPAGSDLPVLELGPGTGAITKAILAAGVSPERLVCIEYNAGFLSHLKKSFKGVTFLQGNAFDLKSALANHPHQKFAAVLSGLPLLNFPMAARTKLVEDAIGLMEQGGPYVQLCYGPKAPVPAKAGGFSATPTKWVLGNIPPARFWVYRAECGQA
jgi:phosphatidylethanolamine/phosphatidyl-N-methylethanolamine N-methyltransferase